MSRPRWVVPGRTYLVTRRCLLRMFLLRPDSMVRRVFEFCLAHAARRFSVRIHAYCVLSNHYHIVLTDTYGNLPRFMHWLDEYVAKCLNRHLERTESFWGPGSFNAVMLADAEAVAAEMLYVYLNPVEAGLTRRACDWPGVRSLPVDLLKPARSIDRPRGFFRDRGPVPRTAELKLELPDQLIDFSPDPVSWLKKAVAAAERAVHEKMRAAGRTFMGARRVEAQSPFDRPQSADPPSELKPTVAVRDKQRRIEILRAFRGFLDAYRAAWKSFAEGNRQVVFPWGTYWMRVRLGVPCAVP
ncbi:MAG: hypothetical protein GY716_01520 [bacterium]|nr:hypothetical protein [bacterium]